MASEESLNTVTLTRNERLMLINQYAILKGLDPAEAETYSRNIEILSNGYEGEYGSIFGFVEPETLSRERSSEIHDILSMYDHLQRSFDELADREGVNEYRIKFPGFSGNEETTEMAFCRYLVADNRWTSLRLANAEMNSGVPLLDRYRGMLKVWRDKSQGDPIRLLSKGDLISVIDSQ